MFSIMKLLIGQKFYKTAEEAQTKIGVFFAVNMISDTEMVELSTLVGTTYTA